MMAIYRCDEISNEVYAAFCEQVVPISDTLRAGEIVKDFGSRTTEILDEAIRAYSEPASRYHKEVSSKKGEELIVKMKKDLVALYVDLISKLRVSATAHFESLVKENIVDDNCILDHFGEVMQILKSKVIAQFVESSAEAIPQQCKGEWDFRSDLDNLERLINKDISSARDNQILRFLEQLKKSMKLTVAEPLEDLLDQANPKMWTHVRDLYQSSFDKIVVRLEKKLVDFECPKEEAQKYVKVTNETLTQLFISAVTARAKGLHNELLKKFESVFKFDDKGLPRKWEKGVDIPAIYQRALESALPLIDLFAIVRLDPHVDYEDVESVPADYIINSKRECAQMKAAFKQAADSMFTSARSDQDKNSVTTQIPTYFVILFIIFAFDDLWPWITNPVLFPIFLCFCLFVGTVWYLGMTNLVLSIARTTVNQVWGQYQHLIPAIPVINGGAAADRLNNNDKDKIKNE